MKVIDSRIRRLQDRLCPDQGQPQRLWFLIQAGCELAFDLDKCTEILDACGFLPTGRFGVLSFFGIPHGLNAKELEQHLRRNGAEICGFGGNQQDLSLSAQAQISAGWGR